MQDVVVMGLGEMGQFMAGGALRAGARVTPLVRGADVGAVLSTVAEGVPLWCAVGESDLEGAVGTIPAERRRDVILVQNGLFPGRWHALGLSDPTVAVVWTNRKRVLPTVVLRPTAVYGRHAAHVAAVHGALDVPCVTLESERALGEELVAKFGLILAVNLLGVLSARTVGEWLSGAPEEVAAAVEESRRLGEALLGEKTHAGTVERAIHTALESMAPLPARGRTAGARVREAIGLAGEHGLALPLLERAAECLAKSG
ncbi:MAG: hypothetical protein EA398_10875 [Deltaproteobacteria bacterium]|nr:MAG: hypothetical protein EA398_10875 [Deltaproteobacteria bacterium]